MKLSIDNDSPGARSCRALYVNGVQMSDCAIITQEHHHFRSCTTEAYCRSKDRGKQNATKQAGK